MINIKTRIVFFLLFSFLSISNTYAYDTSCTQMPLPNSDGYYHAKNGAQPLCCNNTSTVNSWYKAGTGNFAGRCGEESGLINRNDYLDGPKPDSIVKSDFDRDYRNNEADLDHNAFFCDDPNDTYITNTDYCKKAYKSKSSYNCSQNSIPSGARHAKVNGQNICCNDNSIQNQWYKSKGRCGEVDGLYYWGKYIINSGASTTRQTLYSVYDSELQSKWNGDISNLLCDNGYKYVRNTNYCIANSEPTPPESTNDIKSTCIGTIPTGAVQAYFNYDGSYETESWKNKQPLCCNFINDTEEELVNIVGRCGAIFETNYRLQRVYDYGLEQTKIDILDDTNWRLENKLDGDISNLLCPDGYNYVRNTNYCIADSEPTPPAEPEPVCGNSIIETGEQCDDGNNTPGDGCESCQNATTYPTTDPDAPAGSVGGELAGCDTRVGSRTPTWSTCNVNGSWSSSGRIGCTQTVLSRAPNNVYCATRVPQPDDCVDITNASGAIIGESCTPVPDICDNAGCYNATHPASESKNKTISLALSSPNSSCTSNMYANNSDTCDIKLYYSVSTEQYKGISNWGSKGNVSSFFDTSGQKSDRVGGSGVALNFDGLNSSGIPSSTSKSAYFTIGGISSKSPFTSNSGKFKFNLGGTQVEVSGINYDFKKPFVGKIKVSADNGGTWDGSITLGTELLYKVVLQGGHGLTWSGLDNTYTLDNFLSKINFLGDGLEIQDKNIITSTLGSKDGTQFKLRVNTSASATSINDNPGIQINNSIISYQLGGESIKYYLGDNDINSSNDLTLYGEGFLGVNIKGNTQGQGKLDLTNTDIETMSSLTSMDFRKQIRSKASRFIGKLSNGQKVNGTIYFDRTKKLSDINLNGINNIIIKDGNLIIDTNLTSTDLFGIIVLSDGYDVTTDYNNKGNVYVTSNVTKINSIIYADGGLISAKNDGTPYISDSTTRTYNLNKQLLMNGSLFTRNTLGGAIKAGGGKYLLPGGKEIDNFDKAMIYDLNYIRRGNIGCDKNGNNVCTDSGENKSPFILKYDNRVQNTSSQFFGN